MSIKIQNAPNRAAFDVQASQDLRETMRKDPKEGLKAAAQQFETMFLQMVMKSMRDTVPMTVCLVPTRPASTTACWISRWRRTWRPPARGWALPS